MTGILLAGGLSRRFGSPKAFAELDGELFYEKVYQALEAACDDVVIISREEFLPLFPADLDVITDLPAVAGLGPLAGIYTAMKRRPAGCYMVLPCDMPYISSKETLAIKRLATHTADITAIRTVNEDIPLFSIWNGRLETDLKNAIASGQLSVLGLLANVKTEWIASTQVHPDNAVFQNINRSTT